MEIGRRVLLMINHEKQGNKSQERQYKRYGITGTASKMEIWERAVRAQHVRGVGCTLKVCTPFRSGVVVISGAHVRQWSRNDEDVGGS